VAAGLRCDVIERQVFQGDTPEMHECKGFTEERDAERQARERIEDKAVDSIRSAQESADIESARAEAAEAEVERLRGERDEARGQRDMLRRNVRETHIAAMERRIARAVEVAKDMKSSLEVNGTVAAGGFDLLLAILQDEKADADGH